MTSLSVLLFGDLTSVGVTVNDFWQFSPAQRIWKKVKMIEDAGSVPSPRYGHAAADIGVDMFVVEGYNYFNIINVELWRFNVINNF